jgi:hypothetical protein
VVLSLGVSNQNPTYASPPPIRVTRPVNLICFDVITRTTLGDDYRSLSTSLYSFLHSLVTSSPLGSNILLYTLFPNTLSLSFSFSVNDQVSYSLKTTGRIVVLYILIFMFLDSKLEDKSCLHRMIANFLRLQSALNFFLSIIFIRYVCS